MKKTLALMSVLLWILTTLSGCSTGEGKLSPSNPVTLTMWHVYGSQTESPLNVLIEEFNRTAGKEKGIAVSVVSVSNSSEIDAALTASANDEPGSVALPDLFTAYPRVVEKIGAERLLNWKQYLSEEEIAAYVPDFLAEGQFDDRLLMLPIAKSTELCFVNKTLFDRFAADTGADIEDMTDFEALFALCDLYYDWSNGQTMFQINDFYHYFLTNVASLGGSFLKDGKMDFTSDAFLRVWASMARAGIHGGLCVQDGYASDRWKTAEVISNVGSSAGILYLRDYVTYSDNTTEEIETLILPYPSFAGASPTAIQRGSGLFAIRSEDERKNKAAAIFALWIADSEHNVKFATQAGYLPVTQEGFADLLKDTSVVANEKYRMLYDAVSEMFGRYAFFSLPRYEGAGDVQAAFEKNVKFVLGSAHEECLRRVAEGEDAKTVEAELEKQALEELARLMQE